MMFNIYLYYLFYFISVKPFGTAMKKASQKEVETCNFIFMRCDWSN
jgi:hypothetical protein